MTGPVDLTQPREAPRQVEIEGTVRDKMPRCYDGRGVQMQWRAAQDVGRVGVRQATVNLV